MVTGSPCPFSPLVGPHEDPDSHKKENVTRHKLRQHQSPQEFTMAEVKIHNTKADAWIAVKGKVYDITDHILNHPGWDSAAITTVLSILAHIGSDCTQEFVDIHRPYPIAWNQLKAYYIGELAQGS